MKKRSLYIFFLFLGLSGLYAQPVIHDVSYTDVSCNGGNDGSITITIQGGQPPYYYYINAGGVGDFSPQTSDTSYTFTNVSAKNWLITVQDYNEDYAPTITQLISEPDPIIISSESFVPISCNGFNDGQISISATGESGSYKYTLNPVGTESFDGNFSGLSPGIYNVLVEDNSGCSSTATSSDIVLNDPLPLSILSADATDITCFGEGNGIVSVRASGGTGAYTYTLNPGAADVNNSGDFTGLEQGIYSVNVTDVNGCPSVDSNPLQVNEPGELIIQSENSTNISCNGLNDGTITIQASGGNAPYQYTISPGGTSNSTGAFSGLAPDTYSVSVTDANSCGPVVSSLITITEPDELIITSLTSQDISCHNANDGIIIINAEGGTAPFTYIINPGGTSTSDGNFQNLSANVYTIDILDAAGCNPVTSDPVTITNPAPVSIDNISHINISCNGNDNGTITIEASGGTGTLYYTLQPVNITNTSGTFNGLNPGNYNVDITDDNSCGPVNTGNIAITEPDPIIINSEDITDISCFGQSNGSIEVEAIGGTAPLTYTLDPGGTTNNTGEFSGLASGTYTVSVTDAEGCQAVISNPLTVNEPDPLGLLSSVHTDISCHDANDGVVDVEASGGTAPYTYTLNPGAITNTDGEFTGLPANSYTVTIDDANGCPSLTTPSIEITNPDEIRVLSSGYKDISCNGAGNGEITVEGTGGTGQLSYRITPSGTTNTTGIFQGLSQGNYNVHISDENLCPEASTGNITISEPGVIDVSVNGSSKLTLNCFGDNDGNIDITVTGGTPPYTYSWTGPDGYTSPDKDISFLLPGVYNLTVRDANLCSQSFNGIATITEPPELTFSLEKTDIICNGNNNGTITVNATGGTPDYEYSRNGFTYQSSNIFTGLPKNTYTIFVRDANGCTSSDVITIDEPELLEIKSQLYIENNLCNGDTMNEIRILIVNGGVEPYQYSVDGGTNFYSDPDFQNLAAGSYQPTVMDVNGCTADGNPVHFNEIPPIKIEQYLPVDVTDCFGNENGQIYIEAIGGTGVKLYSLDEGAPVTNGLFSNLSGGEHSIMITDENDCEKDTLVTLEQPDEIIFDNVTVTEVTGCSDDANGAITVTAAGGTGPYEYAFDGGPFDSENTFSGLASGDYTVSVLDANTCPKDTIITVSAPLPVSIQDESFTNVSCNGNNDGEIVITASGGTAPYTFTLNPGGISNDNGIFSGLAPDTYIVDVDDVNNCGVASSSLITITEPEGITIDSVITKEIICSGDNDAEIHIYAHGGTEPYLYSIDDEANKYSFKNFTGLTPGEYRVSIEDANGCTMYIDTFIFDDPAPLTIVTEDVTDVTTCNGESTGMIEYEMTGGEGTIEYNFDNTSWNTNTIHSDLPAGTYVIQARDQRGCIKTSSDLVIHEPDEISADITTTPALDEDNKGTITISGAAGGTGTLEFSIDDGSSFSSETFYDGLDAGDYQVVIRDDRGCPYEEEVTVYEVPPLSGTVSANNITCHGDNDGSIEISMSDGNGQIYYSIDNGANFYNTSLFEDLGPGTYTIIAFDEDGRYYNNEVTISEPIELDIFRDVTPASCSSNSTDGEIDITVNGAQGAVSYNWSSGQTSEDLTNITAGTYIISATDEKGCEVTDTIEVPAITTVIADAGPDTSLCPGNTIILQGSGGTTVTWEPTESLSNSNILNPVASPQTSTDYVLTVYGSDDCYDTDTASVIIYPETILGLREDTSLITGNEITLTTTGGPFISYNWQPTEYLDDPSTASPVANPDQSTKFLVSAIDTNGCVISDSVTISIVENLTVYSAFSPNDDGKNDYWDIDNASYYPDIIVEVFSRWGEKVFSSQGYTDEKRWDGTYKGTKVPIGTYYFVVIPYDGAEAITGPVTIVR